MANRIRPLAEKAQSFQIALRQINIEAAADEAGVPPSTLRYDLNKACRQAMARFLLYDETYPKMKKRAYSLGGAFVNMA